MDISGDGEWGAWALNLDEDALLDANLNLDEVEHLFDNDDGGALDDAQPRTLPMAPTPQETRSPYDDYNDALCKHCEDGQRYLNNEMNRLGWAQKNLVFPLSGALQQQHQQMMGDLRARLTATQRDSLKCQRSVPLKPRALTALHALQEALTVLFCQLDVFEAELQALCAAKPFCAARLCIVTQEAGRPVKQNSNGQVLVRVRILTGALADIRPTSTVQALLEGPNNITLPLDNAAAPVTATGVASFEELKFPVSSRSQLVRLRFKVNVQWSSPIASGNGVTHSCLACLSLPALVFYCLLLSVFR
jgi:hypothetical protein